MASRRGSESFSLHESHIQELRLEYMAFFYLSLDVKFQDENH